MVIHDVETYSAQAAVNITGQQRVTSHLLYAAVILNMECTDCRTVTGCIVPREIQSIGTYFKIQTLLIDKLEIEVREHVKVR